MRARWHPSVRAWPTRHAAGHGAPHGAVSWRRAQMPLITDSSISQSDAKRHSLGRQANWGGGRAFASDVPRLQCSPSSPPPPTAPLWTERTMALRSAAVVDRLACFLPVSGTVKSRFADLGAAPVNMTIRDPTHTCVLQYWGWNAGARTGWYNAAHSSAWKCTMHYRLRRVPSVTLRQAEAA